MEPNPEPTGLSSGLVSSYYGNTGLKGEALLTRIEGPIQFKAGDGMVVEAAGTQKWSARYEGLIEAPLTGKLTLGTYSDDGVRIWVDGKLVVDDWKTHPRRWNSFEIDAVRGTRLPIRIEYLQNRGSALLELHWEWNDQRALVPAEYLWHKN